MSTVAFTGTLQCSKCTEGTFSFLLKYRSDVAETWQDLTDWTSRSTAISFNVENVYKLCMLLWFFFAVSSVYNKKRDIWPYLWSFQ